MSVPPTLGVILAGGLGRRMGGGDKPLTMLGGRTLLDHVAQRLAPQCAAGLILSANGDPARFAGFPGPVVPDGVPGHSGPLAGLLAALDHAADRAAPGPPPDFEGQRAGLADNLPKRRRPYEASAASRRLTSQDRTLDTPAYLVSVSCDAPYLPADLVARLHAARAAADVPITVAASGGRRHFTIALWSTDLRDDLRAALVERGERRVGAFIERHGAAVAAWPSAPVDPFLNINTPEDLAAAEAALARSVAENP